MPVKLPDEVKGKAHAGTHHIVGSGGQAYGTAWSSNTCKHPGQKVIYESSKGKKLYAAKGADLNEYSGEWDLIIDLANQVRWSTSFVRSITPKKFDPLKKYCIGQKQVQSDVLSLDWADYQSPPVTLDFWLALRDMLPEKTVMCCVGGHGRTGSCMVALLIAHGIDYYSALETVRTEHCSKAVESLNQEKYLHLMWVEYLKRLIESATAAANTAEVKDLEIDLKFAEDHPPTQADPYGQKKATPMGTISHAGGPGSSWEVRDGALWTKECIEKSCSAPKFCQMPAHQGWVKYDHGSDDNNCFM